MQDDGADVEIERRPTQIQNFSDLVEALKCMAENEQERIRADLARNQTNLEIMGTLQVLVKKLSAGRGDTVIDTGPMEELLEELVGQSHTHPIVGYEFDFLRDQNGFTQKIRATPFKITEA